MNAPKMNRHQRRRFATLFRQANIISMPPNDPRCPRTAPGLCDWSGCTKPWEFVTMATKGKDRKPVARRCVEHRLG